MNLLFLHKHVANNSRTFWLYYYMGEKKLPYVFNGGQINTMN